LSLSVHYGFWSVNVVAFNGDMVRKLAAQLLELAEKQGATIPLLIAHRIMGVSLLYTAEIPEAREHLNLAIAYYDPAKHRQLAPRFGLDSRVAIWSHRTMALWVLGYPQAALADADLALKDAREIGQAAGLIFALPYASWTHIHCGKYTAANDQLDEVIGLTDEKRALFWKALGMSVQGCLFVLNGKAADAVNMITSGIGAFRVNGSNIMDALVLVTFGESQCGNRQIR
jgi:tetratricopeptide (TPR) repeat protein